MLIYCRETIKKLDTPGRHHTRYQWGGGGLTHAVECLLIRIFFVLCRYLCNQSEPRGLCSRMDSTLSLSESRMDYMPGGPRNMGQI